MSKSPVYRIEIAAGLPCQSRRFAVSESPVYRVKIAAGLRCRSRQFVVSKSPVYRIKVAGLPYRNRRQFTISKSPVCGVEVASHRFAVSKSPVYRIEIAAGLPCQNRCRFAVSMSLTKKKSWTLTKTKKNIDKLDQNNKKVYVYKILPVHT